MTGSKEKLRQLAADIAGIMEYERQWQPIVPTISPELGKWFVHAVGSFLSSEKPNLEKALGLVRKQGRQRQGREAKNYSRAVKVHGMLRRKPPATKNEIMEAFRGDVDWKDLQAEQKRYAADIRADNAKEIAAKISARIDARNEKRRRQRLGIKEPD